MRLARSVARLLAAAALLLPWTCGAATNAIQWQRWEQALTSLVVYTNPYRDVTVSVTYTGPDGATLQTFGFWDGANTFKIRCAFPSTGDWSWQTTCSDPSNSGLHQLGDIMASEITYTVSLAVENGNLSESFRQTSKKYDQAASGGFRSVQSIATSEESLTSFGDVVTEGWTILQNIDATNYVQIGFSTAVYGIRLEPGEAAAFRMEPNASLFLKANVAACKVLVWVNED